MSRGPVDVTGLPTPIGPFSVAVTGDVTMLLSGQVAQDRDTGDLVGADAGAQARQIFANIAVILESVGKDESDVLRVGLYLVDMSDFAAVNQVYAESFSSPYPARTAIAVTGLPLGALVEVDALIG